MRNLTTFLLTTLFSSLCYAELNVSDLPFIEGTPLEYSEDTTTNWSVVDYQENDDGYTWVWLQHDSRQAYLVYPNGVNEETFTFPDGTSLAVVPERVNLSFIGEPEQQIELTRFGGKITLDGEVIRVSYTPADVELTESGNEYRLVSNHQLNVSFNAFSFVSDGNLHIPGELSIDTTGDIQMIAGTEGINTIIFESPLDSTWTLAEGENSGTIEIDSTPPLINFESIHNLTGGSGEAKFIFPATESWNISPPSGMCDTLTNQLDSVTISNGGEPQPPVSSSGDTLCLAGSIIHSGGAIISQSGADVFTLEEQLGSNTISTSKSKKKSWAGAANPSFIAFMLLLLLLKRVCTMVTAFNHRRYFLFTQS